MATVAQSVRDIVKEHPEAILVFERLGIDYCCGGERTLAEACAGKKLQPEKVLEEVGREPRQEDDSRLDHWQSAPFHEMIDYIEKRHHAYELEQMKRIAFLAEKVERRHGLDHPELIQLRQVFEAMAADMEGHFHSEEEVLFPHLVNLESDRQTVCPPEFDHLGRPIRHMMEDHDDAGEALRKMRELTGGYRVPADGCASYQELFRSLVDLEQDIHHHVHLENNILFPRALEMADHEQ